MAQVYKFQVSQPVNDTLPRNRISNTFHLQHITGGLSDSALAAVCSDIAAMWQTRYGNAAKEINVKCYDTDAVPNLPRASVTVNAGVVWTCGYPTEIALCLSFAGNNRGDKRGRGRLYLMPQLTDVVNPPTLRPTLAAMDWALDFYRVPNASLPDIGGVDWKFGIRSKVGNSFTQAQQAWVNDDWDHQRSRSTRETQRVTSVREG